MKGSGFEELPRRGLRLGGLEFTLQASESNVVPEP